MNEGTLELVGALEWSDWDCPRPGAPSVDPGKVKALFLRDPGDHVIEAWFPLRTPRSDRPPAARVEEIGHQQLALRVEDEATTLVVGPEGTPEGQWERVWLMLPGPDVSWLSEVGVSDLTIVLQPRLKVFENGPTLRAGPGSSESRDLHAAVQAYHLDRLEACLAALAGVDGVRRLRLASDRVHRCGDRLALGECWRDRADGDGERRAEDADDVDPVHEETSWFGAFGDGFASLMALPIKTIASAPKM